MRRLPASARQPEHVLLPLARSRRALLLAAGGFTLLGTARATGEVISVEAQRQGAAVQVTTQALVRAPFDVIWGAITDYDRLAEFVPGIVSSRVIDKPASGSLIVAQSGKAHLWFFTYLIDVVVQVTEEPPEKLRIKVLRGNLKQLEGAYQIEKVEGRNNEYRLQWSGVIEPALPVPQAISLPLMRTNIGEQFEGMVREIERREARRSAGKP